MPFIPLKKVFNFVGFRSVCPLRYPSGIQAGTPCNFQRSRQSGFINITLPMSENVPTHLLPQISARANNSKVRLPFTRTFLPSKMKKVQCMWPWKREGLCNPSLNCCGDGQKKSACFRKLAFQLPTARSTECSCPDFPSNSSLHVNSLFIYLIIYFFTNFWNGISQSLRNTGSILCSRTNDTAQEEMVHHFFTPGMQHTLTKADQLHRTLGEFYREDICSATQRPKWFQRVRQPNNKHWNMSNTTE